VPFSPTNIYKRKTNDGGTFHFFFSEINFLGIINVLICKKTRSKLFGCILVVNHDMLVVALTTDVLVAWCGETVSSSFVSEVLVQLMVAVSWISDDKHAPELPYWDSHTCPLTLLVAWEKTVTIYSVPKFVPRRNWFSSFHTH
jgi:hypothetical protein